MPRRRALGGSAGVAAPALPAAPASSPSATAARAWALRDLPQDTLLPGALPRPDNLLPRATRSKPSPRTAPGHAPAPGPAHAPARKTARVRTVSSAHTHWRHALVVAVVGVALTLSLVAAWPVVFKSAAPSPTSAAPQTRATALLRTVVAGGRTLYAPQHSFAEVSPSALSARAHHVTIVGASAAATTGQVSLRVVGAKVLLLATPADANHCVFARDEPGTWGTRFATVRATACIAAAAPATGWITR